MARSGLSARASEGFRHQLLQFGTDEELAGVAGGFIREGVVTGEPVLCVTAPSTGRVLRDAVGELVARRVQFVDSTDWHQWPAWSLAGCGSFAAEHTRGGRMRVVTEAGWQGGSLARRREWHRADAASNVIFEELMLSMLCLHDERQLATDSDVLVQARRTHPQLVGSAGAGHSGTYTPPGIFLAECDNDTLPEPRRSVHRSITADSISASRDLVHEMALQLQLPSDRADDLALAVHEVVTNAIEHGGGLAEQQIWTEDDTLICEIRDHGTGFDHAVAGYRRPAVTARRGRGLWIARQVCELVQLRSGSTGTQVRLHLER